MELTLIIFAVVALLEVIVLAVAKLPLSYWQTSLIGMILGIASTALLLQEIAAWTVLLVLFSIYRLVNLLRASKQQSASDYIKARVKRSSYWLITYQVVFGSLAYCAQQADLSTSVWLFGLVIAQLLVALSLLASTLRHVRTTRPPVLTRHFADNDLPALTVAVPARNETAELEACLKSLTANDYPKLEILVLDDCSQNKRTPEIIQAYAQAGVRFLAGQVPPDNWLAKNYAYEQLVQASNGKMLVFCGVDARFEPDSLRKLVETLLSKHKQMMSVMPINQAPTAGDWMELLVQPARYAWELALPRRQLNRPPLLSTCWLISNELLRASGSFAAVSRSISPESHFAKQAIKHDAYTFLRSDKVLGVRSAKQFIEQRATAVRTRYPQLHRRLELTALLALVELLALLLPFAVAAAAISTGSWLLASLSAATCVLLLAQYAIITTLSYERFLVRSLITFPMAALYDVVLLHYSMWQYEFSEVIWKGRNICIPVMRVVPQLPKS